MFRPCLGAPLQRLQHFQRIPERDQRTNIKAHLLQALNEETGETAYAWLLENHEFRLAEFGIDNALDVAFDLVPPGQAQSRHVQRPPVPPIGTQFMEQPVIVLIEQLRLPMAGLVSFARAKNMGG